MKIIKYTENLPPEVIKIGNGKNSLSKALKKIRKEFEKREGVKLVACEVSYVGSDIRPIIFSHIGPHGWQIHDMTITVKFTDNGLTGFTAEEVKEILNKKKIDETACIKQQSEKSNKNQKVKVSKCFKDKILNFIKKLVKL